MKTLRNRKLADDKNMTVTITTTCTLKPDLPQSNSDDENGTCDGEKCCDHTESLLQDLLHDSQEKTEAKQRYKTMNKDSEEFDKVEKNVGYVCSSECHLESRQLLEYDLAPEYMKHNSFIRGGYRKTLDNKLCLDSVFWWTNETINIWSHLFGFLLFLTLAVKDFMSVDMYACFTDKVIVVTVLLCFQACMLLSAVYHTLCCKSQNDCDFYLALDLLGIALSLYTIYVSGIYFAFWCDTGMQHIYIITVTVFFLTALALQIPALNISSNIKTLVFVAWAAYGVVPTLHWTFHMGGIENPVVALFLPRVIGMYTISGLAFLIYITKIPERFFSGKLDYLGHSHQWWHILVVCALYYWHNSGVIYLEYRVNHGCPTNLRIL